ncbi:MAG: hypothetical protein E6K91_06035 [Thaumarchaeota archaeon]|nr:MAG: hypothetical protein E6K91_06035 [Nitrososphaerota archaeon]
MRKAYYKDQNKGGGILSYLTQQRNGYLFIRFKKPLRFSKRRSSCLKESPRMDFSRKTSFYVDRSEMSLEDHQMVDEVEWGLTKDELGLMEESEW